MQVVLRIFLMPPVHPITVLMLVVITTERVKELGTQWTVDAKQNRLLLVQVSVSVATSGYMQCRSQMLPKEVIRFQPCS